MHKSILLILTLFLLQDTCNMWKFAIPHGSGFTLHSRPACESISRTFKGHTLFFKSHFSSFVTKQNCRTYLNSIRANVKPVFPRTSFLRCFHAGKVLRNNVAEIKSSSPTVLARANRKEFRRLLGFAKTEKVQLTG